MISNRELIVPYAAPLLLYVGFASILGDVIPTEINYGLRLVLCTATLFWAWKWYFSLTGPNSLASSILSGLFFGVIGVILWVLLLTPFAPIAEDVEKWSTTSFLLRLTAAGLLVPIFEELMMRGFIFRLALQWSQARKANEDYPLQVALDERTINDVQPGDWSWPAVIISTLVFTSGHQVYELPAAVAYGLLMVFLLIKRKDILSCIVAHSTTNICLAVYVAMTDSWYLW